MFTEIYGEAWAALRRLTGGDPLAAAGLAIFAVAGGAVVAAIIAIALAVGPGR